MIRKSFRIVPIAFAVTGAIYLLLGANPAARDKKNFHFKRNFVISTPPPSLPPFDFQMAVTCEDGYRICYVYSDEGKPMAFVESDQLHVSKGFTREQVMKRLRELAWSDIPTGPKDHNLI